MLYVEQQLNRLDPDADHYSIKLESRDADNDSRSTNWLNIDHDQLARIADILRESDMHDSYAYYTITLSDVGMATIKAFGRNWKVVDFMGQVLKRDVGKRVYAREDQLGGGWFLQLESDKSLKARTQKH